MDYAAKPPAMLNWSMLKGKFVTITFITGTQITGTVGLAFSNAIVLDGNIYVPISSIEHIEL